MGPLDRLRIPNGSDLQRELRSFVLLSKDYGGHQSSSGPLDLWVMVRRRDIELSDESHQECLHLDHTTPRVGVKRSRESGRYK